MVRGLDEDWCAGRTRAPDCATCWVSLYSPGCPGTHSVDQASLELRNPPASAFQVLELKACATTARLHKDPSAPASPVLELKAALRKGLSVSY
ncbi:NAD-dependent protein deacylase sirtuin-5, mitochondrial [Apodemus speciosus]|uniref:NAD-dependent protein deacylase sirtuin-5, mitochondrial n=1 Tax=Apodemus speciosus TaxID=105296 RepID=A0ABQ0ETI4_APOSI